MSNVAMAEAAAGLVGDMPAANERSISEQFRIVAKKWVDLDGAARLLEATKSASFSTLVKRYGPIPVSRAEHEVLASEEWREFIVMMVEARTKANRAKVQMEYLRMKNSEWIAEDANARTERRM